MSLINNITTRDVWARWQRVFAIAFDFDVTRVYDKINEYVVYENKLYRVKSAATQAGLLPDEATDVFEDTLEEPDGSAILEDDMNRIVELAKATFNNYAFNITDSTEETDAKFIKGKEAFYNLCAFMFVQEIYEMEQTYGAISRTLESTRNQSHMSSTRPVPPRIANSVLFARMGHITYGYKYLEAVYYGSKGVHCMVAD